MAAKQKFIVENYLHKAVATMSKDDSGKISMSKVVLNPEIRFSGNEISLQELEEMHHQAHELCFIANSVKTEVLVEVVMP